MAASRSTLTKSEELDRFAKAVGATLVRVFATSGIKTIAQNQTVSASDGGAEFALRGHVDREGDDLVASADIVNRRDGLVLWSITLKRDAAQSRFLQEGFSEFIAGVLRCGSRTRPLMNNDPSTDLFAQYLRLCVAFAADIEQAPELARRLVESAPQYAHSYATQALANALVSVTPTLRGDRRPPAEIARLRKVVYESAKIATEMDPRFDPVLARAIVVDSAVSLAQREQFLLQSIARDQLESASAIYVYALCWRPSVASARREPRSNAL